jgi:hypothetical protein
MNKTGNLFTQKQREHYIWGVALSQWQVVGPWLLRGGKRI